MTPRRLDVYDLTGEARTAVSNCEVTGEKTFFVRDDAPIAVLVSHDEYLAMTETLALIADRDLHRAIEQGREEADRGALLLPEDLDVE